MARSRLRRAAAAALLTTATLAISAPAQAAVPPVADPPASPNPAPPVTAPPVTAPPVTAPPVTPPPVTLTLVTGDKVSLSRGAQGSPDVVSVHMTARPDGTVPGYAIREERGTTIVLPDDAGPYVASGVLDESLFDVGYLAANGYADGQIDRLPLITQLAQGTPAGKLRSSAEALPGAAATRDLPSVHAAAVAVPLEQAGEFWTGVRGDAAQRKQHRLGHDVTKVWLDRRVTVTLDQSVAMVGAPQAWKRGLDGKGVKVAVLDTGYDAGHPDLAGKVTASANFTTDPSVKDEHGHGTHVAGTVAGLGTASDGTHKGVAPGAELLVGKVLNRAGSGTASGVIDGMEWAVEQGARVVSMSLGGAPTGDDGTDLQAQAVNRLSDESGALFVIAAGNSGPSTSTVQTPGIAAAALTVGAVDKQDALASFSSRGPLLFERIAKPDIVAPGVAITAARASGTSMGSPVNDHYTAANGTSMATPHVAGGAAILAQQHPDWPAQRIKAALTASAKDDGYNVFEQGAGRLDLERATGQPVSSTTGALDFGRIGAPEQAPVTKKITYANDSAEPVRLALAYTLRQVGGGADASAALTGPAEVTVPAGASADVEVRLDPALDAGLYGGAVTAQGEGTRLRTAVAFGRTAEVFPVTVNLKSSGSPVWSPTTVHAWNAGNGAVVLAAVTWTSKTTGTVSLPLSPGHWSIMTQYTAGYDGTRPDRSVFLIEPEIEVTGATELTLDEADTTEVSTRTDRPSEFLSRLASYHRYTVSGSRTSFTRASAVREGTLWVTPTEKVTRGSMMFKVEPIRIPVQVSMSVTGGKSVALRPRYHHFGSYQPKFSGHAKVPLVDIGATVEPEEIPRMRGALVLVDLGFKTHPLGTCLLHATVWQAIQDAKPYGVLQSNQHCAGFPWTVPQKATMPIAGILHGEAAALKQRLAEGPVTISVIGDPAQRWMYNLSFHHVGRIPADLRHRAADKDLARIPTSFRSEGPKHGGYKVGSAPSLALQTSINTGWVGVDLPSTPEILLGPILPGAIWYRSAQPEHLPLVAGEERRVSLRAGKLPGESWHAAPRSAGPPAIPPQATNWVRMTPCFACRSGDRLVLSPVYAAPQPLVSGTTPLLGSTRLFRGDQEIKVEPYAGFAGNPSAVLPPEPGRYRLSTDWQRCCGEYAHGQRVKTDWTFTSGHVKAPGMGNQLCVTKEIEGPNSPDCAVSRLLYLRYDTELDGNNQARRGSIAAVRLTPYYEVAPGLPRVRLRSLKVWASTDDGATWRKVPAVGAGDQHMAVVPTPKTGPAGQAVSLKVEAVDRDGTGVTQTVYRAFGLRSG